MAKGAPRRMFVVSMEQVEYYIGLNHGVGNYMIIEDILPAACGILKLFLAPRSLSY